MKAKIKRMLINPMSFFELMKTGSSWKVSEGIPADAKMRGFTLDPLTQNLNVFVEHDSFEPIEIEVKVAPTIVTSFKRL